MVNVVICGSGFIGRIHSQAYKNLPDFKILGIMDANREYMQSAAGVACRKAIG